MESEVYFSFTLSASSSGTKRTEKNSGGSPQWAVSCKQDLVGITTSVALALRDIPMGLSVFDYTWCSPAVADNLMFESSSSGSGQCRLSFALELGSISGGASTCGSPVNYPVLGKWVSTSSPITGGLAALFLLAPT